MNASYGKELYIPTASTGHVKKFCANFRNGSVFSLPMFSCSFLQSKFYGLETSKKVRKSRKECIKKYN